MVMDAVEHDEHGGIRDRKGRSRQDDIAGMPRRGSTESEKSKKTYGRTPDGTVFVVPQTRDMVSQLFSPSQPKNISDLLVVAILGLHILALWMLPSSLRISVFAVVFFIWRASYNAGIGCFLHVQSKHLRLVAWAKQLGIFNDPAARSCRYPWLNKFLQTEMETKIPQDYEFSKAPVEYNTWLVFRRVVDLILMCDFVSYCLFAIACSHRPVGESGAMMTLRWAAGMSLIGFNLWVKLDAHRVVKDYAWYWGDFFFLIDQNLTFDGVFEMAPHPMYSIGYAGFYGISLLAASYKVLLVSIVAHAAQFAFLIWIENPHIEKTYNPPVSRQQRADQLQDNADISGCSGPSSGLDKIVQAPSSVHNLLGLRNFDLRRVTDVSVLLLVCNIAALALMTPTNRWTQAFFLGNAFFWRLCYSIGMGFVLKRQSISKTWTRHFLKYGGSIEEAWQQWKGIYHISMILCYSSFAGACWKMYQAPESWTAEFVALKYSIGCGLVLLQIWTAVSIYDSLGEFGWFFGDFFFLSQRPQLTYNGIYRYLNNPERVMGLAGLWGAALITESAAIFCLAAISHGMTLLFMHFVERPHMQKLYGHSMRSESGLTKTLRRALPSQILQIQGSVDRILEETLDTVEDLLEVARPKLAAGVTSFVRDSTALFKQPTRISITRLPADLAGLDPKDYSIQLLTDQPSITKSRLNNYDSSVTSSSYQYGSPIRLKWTAPMNHSPKDWIGLYRVADNSSREVTHKPSHGRWVATNPDQHSSIVANKGIITSEVCCAGSERHDGEDRDFMSGEMEFSCDKLYWSIGVFEFRYHHNGRHTVMAVSPPFEILIEKFELSTSSPLNAADSSDSQNFTRAVESALLRLVQDCFDRDSKVAPSTVDDCFGGHVERDGKYAKRVVFAMFQMFGIEFAPEIVNADGNVRNLAWRVCRAHRVLQPFMTLSNGRASPSEQIVPSRDASVK